MQVRECVGDTVCLPLLHICAISAVSCMNNTVVNERRPLPQLPVSRGLSCSNTFTLSSCSGWCLSTVLTSSAACTLVLPPDLNPFPSPSRSSYGCWTRQLSFCRLHLLLHRQRHKEHCNNYNHQCHHHLLYIFYSYPCGAGARTAGSDHFCSKPSISTAAISIIITRSNRLLPLLL